MNRRTLLTAAAGVATVILNPDSAAASGGHDQYFETDSLSPTPTRCTTADSHWYRRGIDPGIKARIRTLKREAGKQGILVPNAQPADRVGDLLVHVIIDFAGLRTGARTRKPLVFSQIQSPVTPWHALDTLRQKVRRLEFLGADSGGRVVQIDIVRDYYISREPRSRLKSRDNHCWFLLIAPSVVIDAKGRRLIKRKPTAKEMRLRPNFLDAGNDGLVETLMGNVQPMVTDRARARFPEEVAVMLSEIGTVPPTLIIAYANRDHYPPQPR